MLHRGIYKDYLHMDTYKCFLMETSRYAFLTCNMFFTFLPIFLEENILFWRGEGWKCISVTFINLNALYRAQHNPEPHIAYRIIYISCIYPWYLQFFKNIQLMSSQWTIFRSTIEEYTIPIHWKDQMLLILRPTFPLFLPPIQIF